MAFMYAKLQSNRNLSALVFLLTILVVVMIPNVAFADGGQSSGIDTILRSNTLQGQDTFRNTIAGYLHKPISFIITICGFLIVTFSFLRVAITFLYLMFPDIFDRIDAYQKQTLQGGLKDKRPIDIISYIFALIMPNVKSLTDYANDDTDMDKSPMEYLKKKLPMVIFCIIIGAMIYDGQARAFMAKAADVGMLFGNIIEEHDTVGAVQNFLGDGDRYVFVYDTSTQEGKNKLKIAKALQQHLHGLNPNLKSPEHSDAIGKYVETKVEEIAKNMAKSAKEANIGDFSDIVSFNISITGRSTELSSAAQRALGKGTLQFNISNEKVILDSSSQKYVIVQYSQIVDKDNRNFLFEATKPVEAGKK